MEYHLFISEPRCSRFPVRMETLLLRPKSISERYRQCSIDDHIEYRTKYEADGTWCSKYSLQNKRQIVQTRATASFSNLMDVNDKMRSIAGTWMTCAIGRTIAAPSLVSGLEHSLVLRSTFRLGIA